MSTVPWEKIVRRVILATLIGAYFWFYVAPPKSALDFAKGVGAVFCGALIIGLFLSWPRERAVRITIFVVLAVCLGFAGQIGARDAGHVIAPVFTAIVFLGTLVAMIYIVDCILMFLYRRIVRRPAGAR